jgi:hypothetical protein
MGLTEEGRWASGTITEDGRRVHGDFLTEDGRRVTGIGAAPTELVIQDAAHAHAADNLALTQVHILGVGEASHGHIADALVLTQVHILAVQEAAHGHAADNVVLIQVHQLVIADALHVHTADNVVLALPVSAQRYVEGSLTISSSEGSLSVGGSGQ